MDYGGVLTTNVFDSFRTFCEEEGLDPDAIKQRFRDDPQDTMFANLGAVTRREGFLTREGLIARYEERSGRSVAALNWYQALALWKAAVFMEGNYKRFQAGSTDDEYLALFDRGVPMLAEKAREIAHA